MSNTLARYFAAVLFGYCIDFFIYAGLVMVGISLYLANAAAFAVGTVVNVLLIRRFILPHVRFQLGTDLLLTFVANGAVLLMGTGFLWIFTQLARIDPFSAKLLTNAATFLINYWIRDLLFSRNLRTLG